VAVDALALLFREMASTQRDPGVVVDAVLAGVSALLVLNGPVGHRLDRILAAPGQASERRTAQQTCRAFWNAAHERWPEAKPDADRWLALLADKLGEGPWSDLAALHGAELVLVSAALDRDDNAIRYLEAMLRPHAEVLRQRHGAAVDDARQDVWASLLSGPRRLQGYSGRGSLRAWLEVTLSRRVIDAKRSKARRDEPAPPETFLALEADVHDPELRYLKERYKVEFKHSFEKAAASLTPAERNILRLHFAKRLSIDQIAALVDVHRATAARRIARARETLVERTADNLKARLQLTPTEYDSLVRLVQSQLEFSVERVLGAAD
jgi:RNA polymerase sigma-70 factor, ECF subfamily